MIIESVESCLEEIVEKNEVVLIDTAFSDCKAGLTQELYNCNEELTISSVDMKKKIGQLNYIIGMISKNPHVMTVPEVVAELGVYLKIINGQCDYHRNNIAKKHFKKGRIMQKMDSKTRKYQRIEEHELATLYDLKLYADCVHELVNLLKERTVDVKNNELLEIVKARVKERELKKDYGPRYGRDRSKSKNRLGLDTDERLAVVAYEIASEGKCVAVVSNDFDLNNILSSCLCRTGPLTVPAKGRIRIYGSEMENEAEAEEYKMRFDTALLL